MNRRNFIRGGFLGCLGALLPTISESKSPRIETSKTVIYNPKKKLVLGEPLQDICANTIKNLDAEKIILQNEPIDCTRPWDKWKRIRMGRRIFTIVERDKYSKISNKEWWGKDYYKADV